MRSRLPRLLRRRRWTLFPPLEALGLAKHSLTAGLISLRHLYGVMEVGIRDNEKPFASPVGFTFFGKVSSARRAKNRPPDDFLNALFESPMQISSPNKKDTFTVSFLFGGDKGIRTPDLMNANHTLSQLSYTPATSLLYTKRGRFVKIYFKKISRLLKIITRISSSCSLFHRRNRRFRLFSVSRPFRRLSYREYPFLRPSGAGDIFYEYRRCP